jgi:hypothetical protein
MAFVANGGRSEFERQLGRDKYVRKGDQAILTGPALPRLPLNYEISMDSR